MQLLCITLLFTVVSVFCRKELTTLPKVLELLTTSNCSLGSHNHVFVTDTQCVEIQLILCQNKVDLVITCIRGFLQASNSLKLCCEMGEAIVLLVRTTANSRCWCKLLQTADVGANYCKQQMLVQTTANSRCWCKLLQTADVGANYCKQQILLL